MFDSDSSKNTLNICLTILLVGGVGLLLHDLKVDKEQSKKIAEYYETIDGHYIELKRHVIQVPLSKSIDGTMQVPYKYPYQLVQLSQTTFGVVAIYESTYPVWCEPETDEEGITVCRDFGVSFKEALELTETGGVFEADTKTFPSKRHILLVPIVDSSQSVGYEEHAGYTVAIKSKYLVPGYITYENMTSVVCNATGVDEFGHKIFSEFGIPETYVKTK